MILRKLLASSSHAVANTLEKMRARLALLRDNIRVPADLAETLVEDEEIEEDLLDEILGDMDEGDGPQAVDAKPNPKALERFTNPIEVL